MPAGGTTPTTNSILTGASACWGRSCSAWAACSSRVIQPQVAGVTDRLPLPAIHWLCGVLFVLTLIDLVVTVCGIMHFENSLDNLMAAMTHYGDAMKVAVSDVTGKMSESWKSGKEMSFDFMMRVRDAAMSIFNRQQRRMIASFPKLRTERNNDVLEQLRRILESLYRH